MDVFDIWLLEFLWQCVYSGMFLDASQRNLCGARVHTQVSHKQGKNLTHYAISQTPQNFNCSMKMQAFNLGGISGTLAKIIPLESIYASLLGFVRLAPCL